MRKTLGQKGEKRAALLLKNKDFCILHRNFVCRIGELDLIAKKHKLLVFCEVKTRRSTQYGLPIEAITWHKQKKIRNMAELFIGNTHLDFEDVRFDVITINEKTNQIEHVENAF